MADQVRMAGQAVAAGPRSGVDSGRAGELLQALGAELARQGVGSDVVVSGFRPRLRLHLVFEALDPDACFEDNVVAAPDSGGCWWFWWPWAERIAGAGDVRQAARMICGPLEPGDPGEHDGW